MLLRVAASDGVQGDYFCFGIGIEGCMSRASAWCLFCTYLMCMLMAYIHAYMYEHRFFDTLKLLVLTMFCIKQWSIPERQE
jgi:hypothetical protein